MSGEIGAASSPDTAEESVKAVEESQSEYNPARKRPRSEPDKRVETNRSGLPKDPFEWIGMKVRRRKDGAVFTVRNVFKNQRVELEKSWMSYSCDVMTVRTGYERSL